jgi:phospholipid/cholesterol/gamma-HCH transport system ATP-binding protein
MGQEVNESKSDVARPAESTKPVVLELSGVSFRGRSESGIRLQRVDLRIRAGELVTVQLDRATSTREAASMIQGLIPPIEGTVKFCSEDWLGTDYDRHFRMRSRIGRVFEGQAWIENLNVNENVTLSARHHGQSDASIEAELQYWVSRLGIEGINHKRPAFVEPSVLQVHQWIRAFLGSPALVILERPLQFLSTTWLPKLVDAIEAIRSRGAAVLWFTSNQELDLAASASPLVRLRWHQEKLEHVDGGISDE